MLDEWIKLDARGTGALVNQDGGGGRTRDTQGDRQHAGIGEPVCGGGATPIEPKNGASGSVMPGANSTVVAPGVQRSSLSPA